MIQDWLVTYQMPMFRNDIEPNNTRPINLTNCMHTNRREWMCNNTEPNITMTLNPRCMDPRTVRRFLIFVFEMVQCYLCLKWYNAIRAGSYPNGTIFLWPLTNSLL